MKPGDIISHYRVLGLLGAGGMGEVYKAEDTRLKRLVAIKVLPAAVNEQSDAKQRLIVEAQAASALDHPNICTIYEIDETPGGRLFLVMAYYEGETLASRLGGGPVPVDHAIEILTQLTDAVAAAHDAGVIHRDIKPANIFLIARASGAPLVKLLDFGIAKLADQTGVTRTGSTVGTAAYMAPEHISGHAIDARADIWSIGVVLYELIGRRRPFNSDNALALVKSIAEDEPPPLQSLRPEMPAAIDAIARRALRKRVTDRYATSRELLADLDAVRRSLAPTMAMPTAAAPRSTAVRWIAVAAVVVIAVAAAARFMMQRVRASEIDATVVELRTLVESEQYTKAFRRLHTLRPEIAADPAVAAVSRDFFFPLRVISDPPGATLAMKGYDEPDSEWITIGTTPVTTRTSITAYRWRITLPGYEAFEGSGPPISSGELSFTLHPNGTSPDGMISVPGGASTAGRLGDFFIDRYEVTNAAFKAFVDAGGYRNASYWTEPFVKDGRKLSFAEAMAEFRDTTGRPGPSTWELGSHPDGQAEFPVGGISWYEAAAYANFKGRSLPTVYHWRLAALQSIHSQILEASNFSGKSPAKVGAYPGLGAYGTYDMAGNMKEWCQNAVEDKRYILGGAWNEPNYQYRGSDARGPFDRSSNNGVRLMSATTDVPAAALAEVPRLYRDYGREKPVNDDVFAAFARLYAYDTGDLAGTSVPAGETDTWRVERVSYNAAYSGETIPAYLYLPKAAKPPYQTVVYFPHSGGTLLDSFQQAEMAYLAFIIKGGRALLFPMYRGTYERRLKTPASGPNGGRDLVIQQVKDVRRSVDYLLTRSDVAHDKLAFFGVSLGAYRAPIILAVEPRFNTGILWSGGFPTTAQLPEIDPINFAPRVKTPLLMLNGRDDFTYPVEVSQEPLFRMLGTPAADKGRGLYAGGHVFPFSRMIKDSLDWLDKYLGTPN